MRTKKAVLNSITSMILQVVTAICGFIIPRLIISSYGSEINGAISSISQFLGYISMLEAGVGGITRSALYKPLAENNSERVSALINATSDFFKKLGLIFAVYTIIIALFFNRFTDTILDWTFTFSLVLIISISMFAQYFFGITSSLVLEADQRAYFSNILNIITVIVNAIFSVVLINLGATIHVVKLVSSLIYVVKPFFIYFLVKKRYNINTKVPKDENALKQRWNALGHHIAYFLYNSTDIMVLTFFLDLKKVSVYSVYSMIIVGIRNIVSALSGGSASAFGNMIAKSETENLKKSFSMMVTIVSIISIILFGTTGIVLFDFVRLYTKNVTDINYILPLFGLLFVLSAIINCIKQPYYNIITAAGHYKETQRGAFIEAALNFLLSVLLVNTFGLPGVLVGTIIAAVYRMIDLIIYLKNNILYLDLKKLLLRHSVNAINLILIVLVNGLLLSFNALTYNDWIYKSIITVVLVSIVTISLNIIFYKRELLTISNKLIRVFKKK